MEVLEDIKDKKKPVPGIVGVLAILNYLVLGIIILGIIYNLGQLIMFYNSPGQINIRGFGFVLLSNSIIILLLSLSFYGAILMHKGRKKGFYFYVPGIGLVGIYALYVLFFSTFRLAGSDEMATFIIAAVAFLFIIIFATQLKQLT